jgi:hypothetical protein
MRRIFVFQLILNFIEEAVAIVPANAQIDKITENYTHMMKVSQKTLNHLQGTSEKAGPERGATRSQQRDNGFNQRPYDGTTQSRKRESIAKKRSNLNTSEKDVGCNKCHNKGHIAANCRSSWTNQGG